VLHGLDTERALLLAGGYNRRKRLASGDVQEPRWYQAVAIRRTLAAMARGESRVLLLMATGTRKTFIAMQIVHMLREHARRVTPDRNYRVLYLADREELIDAPKRKDFSTAFGEGPLRRVAGAADRSREIYFATYQALSGGDEEALFRGYRPEYESERTIYLPDELIELLSEDVCLHTPTGDPTRWLFSEGDRPWHDNLVDYRWRSTRADAGVTFKLHELRHYFASGLIAAGCDVVTVQRAMGHS
jgi:integrase